MTIFLFFIFYCCDKLKKIFLKKSSSFIVSLYSFTIEFLNHFWKINNLNLLKKTKLVDIEDINLIKKHSFFYTQQYDCNLNHKVILDCIIKLSLNKLHCCNRT